MRQTALDRVRRGSLMEEADRIVSQSGNVNMNDAGQLAELVAKNGAEQCLARVICELTQNPKTHGDQGNKFAQSLLKFRQSKHPKVKYYLDAMTAGAKAKSSEQCKPQYPQCSHSTQDIIQVGNKILK